MHTSRGHYEINEYLAYVPIREATIVHATQTNKSTDGRRAAWHRCLA